MPYRRRSIWIDVFGVCALLTLLLVPLAYLVTSVSGGGIGGGEGGAGHRSGSDPSPVVRPHRVPPGAPTLGPPPTPTDGRASGAAAPFSDGWQARATPDLTGASGRGDPGSDASVGNNPVGGGPNLGMTGRSASRGEPSGTGGSSTGAISGGGPKLAVRNPGRGVGPATATGPGSAGPAARGEQSAQDEAQRLAGRMRALSGQLGQMQDGTAPSPAQGPAEASAPDEPDAPSRRDPGSPSNVPIDDHVHWLAVAGLLWGLWRLGRGA